MWISLIEISQVPWSFLAVKTTTPVSSPTIHSQIRIWRAWGPSERPFCNTILVLTIFTVTLCPLVPGRSWSTFVNSGFLNPGLVSAIFQWVCNNKWQRIKHKFLTKTIRSHGRWVHDRLFSFRQYIDQIDTRVMVKQISEGTQYCHDKRDDRDSTNVSNNRHKQCMLFFALFKHTETKRTRIQTYAYNY